MLQFICFYFVLHFSYLLYLSLLDLILASDHEGIDNPFLRWVQVFDCLCRCIDWGLACFSYWIDTLVLNWGKYLFILCCITLPSSWEKPTQAQEVAGRISGTTAGEIYAKSSQDLISHQFANFWHRCRGDLRQAETYQVPIINSHLLHYIIRHLPLVFLSPTVGDIPRGVNRPEV